LGAKPFTLIVMKHSILLTLLTMSSIILIAQKQTSYTDSLKAFQRDYVQNHEIVEGKDKEFFRFFPIDSNYCVICKFEKVNDKVGFLMKTSGTIQNRYFIYGKISFTIHDTALQLFIYQNEDLLNSPDYKDYLFIPYTDATSGDESYGGGKYLDIRMGEIRNNHLVIDFNKAYNPYCAYTIGYSCPIPPKENHLKIAIRAGEKVFGKPE
jgi:uncharacterized protein (DUF1684 family)